MAATHYLIAGSNRGIGRGLVAHYLSQPNNTIIAGVRNPQDETSLSLSTLPVGTNSKLIVVKLDTSSDTDAPTAISNIQTSHNLSSLDVVIAVAGIARLAPIADLTSTDLLEHVNVNAAGPVRLFQATRTLLQRSANPRFVVIGTGLASLTNVAMWPIPIAAYGASKATVHYLVRRIHVENEWLTALPIHPGIVQTDMGNSASQAAGLEKAEVPLDECIAGLTDVINTATRETGSGPFIDYKRNEVPW